VTTFSTLIYLKLCKSLNAPNGENVTLRRDRYLIIFGQRVSG